MEKKITVPGRDPFFSFSVSCYELLLAYALHLPPKTPGAEDTNTKCNQNEPARNIKTNSNISLSKGVG